MFFSFRQLYVQLNELNGLLNCYMTYLKKLFKFMHYIVVTSITVYNHNQW